MRPTVQAGGFLRRGFVAQPQAIVVRQPVVVRRQVVVQPQALVLRNGGDVVLPQTSCAPVVTGQALTIQTQPLQGGVVIFH
ncbi:MAG: hypothetical protein QM775_16735 [Pirellulales bacterium]